MQTVIIGGGRGAHAIIDLAASDHLKEISLDIQLVVDPDPNAPGLVCRGFFFIGRPVTSLDKVQNSTDYLRRLSRRNC